MVNLITAIIGLYFLFIQQGGVYAIPKSNFFQFGMDVGDRTFSKSDDARVHRSTPFRVEVFGPTWWSNRASVSYLLSQLVSTVAYGVAVVFKLRQVG